MRGCYMAVIIGQDSRCLVPDAGRSEAETCPPLEDTALAGMTGCLELPDIPVQSYLFECSSSQTRS